jgi:flagellar hook-basal body complex protein FliE
MTATGQSKPAVPASETGSASDFSAVMASLAEQAASNLKAGEDASMKGLQGQMPVQDVVQAVMTAQTSLQTALAVRDKAVSAYQSLISMQI